MITAANLKAAYDALAGEHPTYWFNELTVDANGNLVTPKDATFYLLQLSADPAVGDLDGEAYSRALLIVQAWSTTRGNEYAVRDTANTELTALRWERINTTSLQGDNVRFGVSTTFERTA